jgi:hypothetical protein
VCSLYISTFDFPKFSLKEIKNICLNHKHTWRRNTTSALETIVPTILKNDDVEYIPKLDKLG